MLLASTGRIIVWYLSPPMLEVANKLPHEHTTLSNLELSMYVIKYVFLSLLSNITYINACTNDYFWGHAALQNQNCKSFG